MAQFSSGMKMWNPKATVNAASRVMMKEYMSKAEEAFDLLGGLPWNLKHRTKQA